MALGTGKTTHPRADSNAGRFPENVSPSIRQTEKAFSLFQPKPRYRGAYRGMHQVS